MVECSAHPGSPPPYRRSRWCRGIHAASELEVLGDVAGVRRWSRCTTRPDGNRKPGGKACDQSLPPAARDRILQIRNPTNAATRRRGQKFPHDHPVCSSGQYSDGQAGDPDPVAPGAALSADVAVVMPGPARRGSAPWHRNARPCRSRVSGLGGGRDAARRHCSTDVRAPPATGQGWRRVGFEIERSCSPCVRQPRRCRHRSTGRGGRALAQPAATSGLGRVGLAGSTVPRARPATRWPRQLV